MGEVGDLVRERKGDKYRRSKEGKKTLRMPEKVPRNHTIKNLPKITYTEGKSVYNISTLKETFPSRLKMLPPRAKDHLTTPLHQMPSGLTREEVTLIPWCHIPRVNLLSS